MLKHGQSRRKVKKSLEYRAWTAMKTRCENQRVKEYARYGGRGITVCDRWKIFENFFADMGVKPSSKHSLDRIDNNLGYEPSNCRWATIAEQTRNRGGLRTNRLVTVHGKTMCVADAAMLFCLPINTIHNRLNRGLSDEEACLTPRYRVRYISSPRSVSPLPSVEV
jgi:hypothetical protein